MEPPPGGFQELDNCAAMVGVAVGGCFMSTTMTQSEPCVIFFPVTDQTANSRDSAHGGEEVELFDTEDEKMCGCPCLTLIQLYLRLLNP